MKTQTTSPDHDRKRSRWFIPGSKLVLVIYALLMAGVLVVASSPKLALNGLIVLTPIVLTLLLILRLISRGRGGVGAEACVVLILIAWLMVLFNL